MNCTLQNAHKFTLQCGHHCPLAEKPWRNQCDSFLALAKAPSTGLRETQFDLPHAGINLQSKLTSERWLSATGPPRQALVASLPAGYGWPFWARLTSHRSRSGCTGLRFCRKLFCPVQNLLNFVVSDQTRGDFFSLSPQPTLLLPWRCASCVLRGALRCVVSLRRTQLAPAKQRTVSKASQNTCFCMFYLLHHLFLVGPERRDVNLWRHKRRSDVRVERPSRRLFLVTNHKCAHQT